VTPCYSSNINDVDANAIVLLRKQLGQAYRMTHVVKNVFKPDTSSTDMNKSDVVVVYNARLSRHIAVELVLGLACSGNAVKPIII